MNGIRAVIFDMDGVLIDTAQLHAQVQAELLSAHGLAITADEINRRYKAIPDKELFALAFTDAGMEPGDIEALFAEKWHRMLAHRGGIIPIAGAAQTLIALHAQGYLIAVASSSIKEYVLFALRHIGVADHVDAVVTVEDVARGKPAPDIFLRAAEMLGAAPRECVVIEDSRAGMQAAKAAGMFCIGLVSDPADESEYPADVVIRSFEEMQERIQDGELLQA